MNNKTEELRSTTSHFCGSVPYGWDDLIIGVEELMGMIHVVDCFLNPGNLSGHYWEPPSVCKGVGPQDAGSE
jgi:hypothetical protein